MGKTVEIEGLVQQKKNIYGNEGICSRLLVGVRSCCRCLGKIRLYRYHRAFQSTPEYNKTKTTAVVTTAKPGPSSLKSQPRTT